MTSQASRHSVAVVLLRLAKLIVVLALACSIGLHWIAFQSFAWASMLVENLQRDSFAQAMTHTFDGQHPCHLCKAIADGKKSEKKSDWTPGYKTFEFTPVTSDCEVAVSAKFPLPSHFVQPGETRSESPPTPPAPRLRGLNSSFVCATVARVFLISLTEVPRIAVSQISIKYNEY